MQAAGRESQGGQDALTAAVNKARQALCMRCINGAIDGAKPLLVHVAVLMYLVTDDFSFSELGFPHAAC